jgi:hypothetical protein
MPGIDPRTEQSFHVGYTSIFRNGVRQCNPSDPIHTQILAEWESPLPFIQAHSTPEECTPHDLAINRGPDNLMVASTTAVQCSVGAILHLGADCQFDISDAGSGVLYLSGASPIEVLSPASLAGSRSPGEEIIPGVLEPIDFGTVTLHFTASGTYVLRGFPTGFGSGAAGVADVTITVG